MKKIISMAMLIIATSSVLFVACNKSDTRLQEKPKASTTAKQISNGDIVNYCFGCGTAYDPNFYCNDNGMCDQFHGICFETEANAVSQENNLGFKIDDAQCYSVRDNFLAKTGKGQRYITYYYSLSDFAMQKGFITPQTAYSYFTAANDLLHIVSVIQNGQDTDIPVTSELKNEFMGFINQYSAAGPNTLQQGYLNNIKTDLNKYANQTKAFIVNDLNN